MSMTDPVADMLTRIRNGLTRRKETVDVPGSKLHEAIARILVEEGYVLDYRKIDDDKQGILRVELKYGEGRQAAITGLRRVSTPGRRVYAKKSALPRVLNGLGTAIVSTSHGVMTERNCRRRGIGGEVLCYIW